MSVARFIADQRSPRHERSSRPGAATSTTPAGATAPPGCCRRPSTRRSLSTSRRQLRRTLHVFGGSPAGRWLKCVSTSGWCVRCGPGATRPTACVGAQSSGLSILRRAKAFRSISSPGKHTHWLVP